VRAVLWFAAATREAIIPAKGIVTSRSSGKPYLRMRIQIVE
jgi:hypothetical protein